MWVTQVCLHQFYWPFWTQNQSLIISASECESVSPDFLQLRKTNKPSLVWIQTHTWSSNYVTLDFLYNTKCILEQHILWVANNYYLFFDLFFAVLVIIEGTWGSVNDIIHTIKLLICFDACFSEGIYVVSVNNKVNIKKLSPLTIETHLQKLSRTKSHCSDTSTHTVMIFTLITALLLCSLSKYCYWITPQQWL